jgi:hypothetical protein
MGNTESSKKDEGEHTTMPINEKEKKWVFFKFRTSIYPDSHKIIQFLSISLITFDRSNIKYCFAGVDI